MSKTTQPLFTKDQELRALEIYNALNQNNDLFEQKIKVISTKLKQGGEKRDKDGNLVINDFGEPERWDDSYYLISKLNNSKAGSCGFICCKIYKFKIFCCYDKDYKVDDKRFSSF